MATNKKVWMKPHIPTHVGYGHYLGGGFGVLIRLIGSLLAEVIPPSWMPVISSFFAQAFRSCHSGVFSTAGSRGCLVDGKPHFASGYSLS